MTNRMAHIIQCQNLHKSYSGLDVSVLRGIDLTVQAGEQIAIVGTSGSGKSTLLHLMGGLDSATLGEVQIENQNLATISDTQKGKIRNQTLGFVYQFHHLLPEFTAQENVALPLLIRRIPQAEAMKQAADILAQVGLRARMAHMPSEMSGGERQRAALARALVTQPKCILADEPTGNLDRTTAHQVFDLLIKINQLHNTSLVVVTHDLSLAAKMQRRYQLVDGQLKPLM